MNLLSRARNRGVGLLALLLGLGLTLQAQAQAKELLVYFPNWGVYGAIHQTMKVGDMPWDKITGINHAFWTVDAQFKLVSTDDWADLGMSMPHSDPQWDPSWPPGYERLAGHFGEYRHYKQMHPGVTLYVSVGGWTRSENFHAMAMSAATRKVFTDSMLEFFRKYPFFDGIDLDWEYPGINRPKDPADQYDRGAPGGPEDRQNFTLLLADVRAALNGAGLQSKKITIAAPLGIDKIEKVEPGLYHRSLDRLNVMTYDIHGAWERVTNHSAALCWSAADPSATMPVNAKEKYNTDWAMKHYMRLGVPASKLLVGSPFYSRGWAMVDASSGHNGLYAKAAGNHRGMWDDPMYPTPGGQEPYFHLKTLETAPGWTKVFDPVAHGTYLYNQSRGVMLSYEDERSLSERIGYLHGNGFAGLFVWEITGDRAPAFPFTSLARRLLDSPPAPPTPCPPYTGGGAGAGVAGSGVAGTGLAGVTGAAGTGIAGMGMAGIPGAAGTGMAGAAGAGLAGMTGVAGTGMAGATGAAGATGGAGTGLAGTGLAGSTGGAGAGMAGVTGAAGAGGGVTGAAGTGLAGAAVAGVTGAAGGVVTGVAGVIGVAGAAASPGPTTGGAAGSLGSAGRSSAADNGGCGCSVPGRSTAGRLPSALLALALGLLLRRRLRRFEGRERAARLRS